MTPHPPAITREHRDARGRLLPGNPTEWAPGKSGNPLGRPSSERDVTEAARKLAMEGLQNLAEVMRDRKAQAIARVRAVEILLERGYGKAPQKLVIETDVAGMDNPALAAFIRAKLEEATRTIEGRAEDVTEDDGGTERGTLAVAADNPLKAAQTRRKASPP